MLKSVTVSLSFGFVLLLELFSLIYLFFFILDKDENAAFSVVLLLLFCLRTTPNCSQDSEHSWLCAQWVAPDISHPITAVSMGINSGTSMVFFQVSSLAHQPLDSEHLLFTRCCCGVYQLLVGTEDSKQLEKFYGIVIHFDSFLLAVAFTLALFLVGHNCRFEDHCSRHQTSSCCSGPIGLGRRQIHY